MTPENRPLVFLLKPGALKRDDQGNILDARSSVTLIETSGRRIIVDSGQEGDGEMIHKALADLGLAESDIDCIVNTHSHPDHCANNSMFSRARVILPRDGEWIAPGVQALATPGHSPDSISIVIEEGLLCGRKDGLLRRREDDLLRRKKDAPETYAQRIVVAGDALPTQGNFQKSVPPAIHTDRDLAVRSMQKVIRLADVVIPGHDLPFTVI